VTVKITSVAGFSSSSAMLVEALGGSHRYEMELIPANDSAPRRLYRRGVRRRDLDSHRHVHRVPLNASVTLVLVMAGMDHVSVEKWLFLPRNIEAHRPARAFGGCVW
jgi:hypothetical protein